MSPSLPSSYKKKGWIPRSNLHPEAIKDYEMEVGAYVQGWRFRCPDCDLPCKSQRGVKIHQVRTHKAAKPQAFEGRLTDKPVQVSKLIDLQKSRPAVHCGEQILENVFKFQYLGTVFAANGLQCTMSTPGWSWQCRDVVNFVISSTHLTCL